MSSGTTAAPNTSHKTSPAEASAAAEHSYAAGPSSPSPPPLPLPAHRSKSSPVSAHGTAAASSTAKRRSSDAKDKDKDNVNVNAKAQSHDDSEAETEILSDPEQNRARGNNVAMGAGRAIKFEERDDRHGHGGGGGAAADAPPRDGRKRMGNGASIDEGTALSIATSSGNLRNYNLNRAAHLDKVASNTSTSTSTSALTSGHTNVRAVSVGGAKKRKIHEDHHLRNLERPRQRLKSDSSAKTPASATHNRRFQPASPSISSPGPRAHRRSASSHSALPSTSGRKRPDVSSGPDRKAWASESSPSASSSPQPTTPALSNYTTSRAKRNSARSLVSPARQSQMPHKKNVDRFGATRLARECCRSNPTIEAVMEAYEANPEELDQEDYAGFAPIQKAALHGYATIVKFLLDKGCRSNCQSSEGDTPLIDAVENQHFDVVIALLNAGVNPHHANNKGERAIDVIADDYDDAEALREALDKAMREYPSDYAHDADTPRVNASDLKNPDRQDLLYLESTIGNLRKFSGTGDMQAVHQFLSGGVAPDNQCAIAAARGGHEEVLSLLLANPSFRGDRDPDPKTHAQTPLLNTIGRGHLGVIRMLLDQDNFNPTRRNSDGKTYWELAQERAGPKWQLEVDLLKEKYDEYKAKQQALKKRKMSAAHSAEKSSKMPKLKSPESPKVKKTRESSPVRQMKKTSANALRTQMEHERKKMSDKLAASGASSKTSGDREERRMSKVMSAPSRDGKKRRRVVDDDDESESDQVEETTSKQQLSKSTMKHRRSSDAAISSFKQRKEGFSSPSVSAASKDRVRDKDRKPSGISGIKPKRPKEKGRDGQTVHDTAHADEAMPDAPTRSGPLSGISVKKPEPKQHTPDPIRLQRIAERDKEATRLRLARERERLAEEQRAAEQKRVERLGRIEKYPIALKHACEKGRNRPLHFSGKEYGISMCFLPIRTVFRAEIEPECEDALRQELFMASFQAVGVLGLPELDLTAASASKAWRTIAMTAKMRGRFLAAYDVSALATVSGGDGDEELFERFDGSGGDDGEDAIDGARRRFLAMEPLSWIRVADFDRAVAEEEWLKPLVMEKLGMKLRGEAGDGEERLPELAAHIAALEGRGGALLARTVRRSVDGEGGEEEEEEEEEEAMPVKAEDAARMMGDAMGNGHGRAVLDVHVDST